ncbi:ribosomal protein L6P/L9E [Sphingomonas sp. PvP055]
MSRIGKKPVTVPAGVTATIDAGQISVKGPKGTLAMPLRDEISYTLEDGGISVVPANETKRARAFWGMQRTMVQNLITGGVGWLHQEAADQRRWLSCCGPGSQPEPQAGL